ncbi:RdgB/HAM1 family non-canonical purine NTP pyrophosphatase [Eggerthellaceae bacterium zg-1084]|uniref:RdgB/HAM1 family non-canonical purine NTP pyrophosphatase n=1 Tax=Berryella wangjianweii TaxID=2734634 RepID=UPI001551E080|nr:RdgB/HAM1 family non-canonical purine NTP pyrophosphatase [Berryella wangjianweii]NPD30472.1 RdgB/HAM1 family non-canonical purine NTP pyrophosphatase [Berryella wangjianweii]
MRTIVIATNNAHKAAEIAEALSLPGCTFKTLDQAGVVSDPVEDADTFEGNALIKARAAHTASGGMAVLADDSGLEVDALSGAPGVHSARYAGEPTSDARNNRKLLTALEDVPDELRTARFVCTLALVDEQGKETVVRGTVEGRIGRRPQGDGGFGYDPLFWPDAFEGRCTLAEVSRSRKAAVSHRGNALRLLRKIITEAE